MVGDAKFAVKLMLRCLIGINVRHFANRGLPEILMNENEFLSYFNKQLFKNNILSLFSSKCTCKWPLFWPYLSKLKLTLNLNIILCVNATFSGLCQTFKNEFEKTLGVLGSANPGPSCSKGG